MSSPWTSSRAVSLHVALVIFVPGCVALTWWQVSRALSGNTLSWAYTVEWPIFGAYAVFMWWKLVHDQVAPTPRRHPEARHPEARDPEAQVPAPGDAGLPGEDRDDEAAAYNRYLADLNASGRQKRW